MDDMYEEFDREDEAIEEFDLAEFLSWYWRNFIGWLRKEYARRPQKTVRRVAEAILQNIEDTNLDIEDPSLAKAMRAVSEDDIILWLEKL